MVMASPPSPALARKCLRESVPCRGSASGCSARSGTCRSLLSMKALLVTRRRSGACRHNNAGPTVAGGFRRRSRVEITTWGPRELPALREITDAALPGEDLSEDELATVVEEGTILATADGAGAVLIVGSATVAL